MSDESLDFECEQCKVNKYCGTLITCEQAKMMYQQGRADKYQEITTEYMLLTKKQAEEIRADAIDEFVEFANTMPTVETEDGEIRPLWLEEMAELMKEQKNDNT